MPVLLTADQLRRDLALRDLSDPTEGPHAIQQLVEAGVAALAAIWEVDRASGRWRPG